MEIRIFEAAGTDVAGRSVLRSSGQSDRGDEFSGMMSEAVNDTRGTDRKELARAEGANQKEDVPETTEKGGVEAVETGKSKEVEHAVKPEKAGKDAGAEKNEEDAGVDKAEKAVNAEDMEDKGAARGEKGDRPEDGKGDVQPVAAPVAPVEPKEIKTVKTMAGASEGVAPVKVLAAEGPESAGALEAVTEMDQVLTEEGFEAELKEADGVMAAKTGVEKVVKHVETAPVETPDPETAEVEERAVDKGVEVKEAAEHGKRPQGRESKAVAFSPSPVQAGVKAEVSAPAVNTAAVVPVEEFKSPLNGGFDPSGQEEAGKEGFQDTKTAGPGNVTFLKKDGFSIEPASPAKPLAGSDKAEVYEKLSAGVRMSVAKGGGEVRLNLRPEHLGSLNIRLNVEDSVVRVRIVVENASVKQMLESDNGALKEILGKQGLVLDTYSVEASPKAFSSGDRGFSGFADTNFSGFKGNGQEGFSGRTGHEAGRNAAVMEGGERIEGAVPVDTLMPRHKENIDVFI